MSKVYPHFPYQPSKAVMSASSDPRERKWPMSPGGSRADVQGAKIWDKKQITSNHEAMWPLPCGSYEISKAQREISECRTGSVVHRRLRGWLCCCARPAPSPAPLRSVQAPSNISNLKANLLPSREGCRWEVQFPRPPLSLWLFFPQLFCLVSSSFI